ncbi:MAG TPA: cytochrome B6 [Geobacter sp.]|nr:cytochrome B6 [Geobacter sp.]
MENDGRRKFLGVCLAGATVAATAAVAYPVFRYLAPRSGQLSSGKISFTAGELPEGEAKFFEYAGSSAVLVKTKTGEMVALSAVCTHLGCIVQWIKEKQQFLCPCHGGLFATDGTVVGGPPPRPLAKIPITLTEGKITVG